MVFFFSSRRRHTRSLCDWSSDVCSSDLTSSLASSSTASKSNFNLLSHSTIPKPQTLEILLVEPMFMPEIHTKDGFQQWKMRGEHPKCKGKCSERISPDWIYTSHGSVLNTLNRSIY